MTNPVQWKIFIAFLIKDLKVRIQTPHGAPKGLQAKGKRMNFRILFRTLDEVSQNNEKPVGKNDLSI